METAADTEAVKGTAGYFNRRNDCGCRGVPDGQHIPPCGQCQTPEAPRCPNCGYRSDPLRQWTPEQDLEYVVCPVCGHLDF